MKRVILIGCGKTKLEGEHEARDLYTGSLFRAARRYAEGASTYWWIVSAKHGALCPFERITSYEMRLPGRRDLRERWGTAAASTVYGYMSDRDLGWQEDYSMGFYVEVLAGEDYADPVVAHFTRLKVQCLQPLRGMQVGERLAWFKQRREGTRKEPNK